MEGKWGREWERAGGCRAWVGGIEPKLNGVLFTTSNPNLRWLPLRMGRDLVLKIFLALSPEEMQGQNYFKAGPCLPWLSNVPCPNALPTKTCIVPPSRYQAPGMPPEGFLGAMCLGFLLI